ncbi:transposable element Tcb2 transposase [Trichonephila clavipes]|nr:transposable element Tcb2 transposase [Trichonephila clavipes]
MFSLTRDSHLIFIWREPRIHYHLSNVREIDHYGSGNLMVRADIPLNSRTNFHVFERGTVTVVRHRDEVLEPYVRLFTDSNGVILF